MASVGTEPNGRKRVQFLGLDGKRRTLRLGVIPADAARVVADHIDVILLAAREGIILDGCDAKELKRLSSHLRSRAIDTADWIEKLSPAERKKLAAVGVVNPVESTAAHRAELMQLAGFIDRYITGRSDAKESTKTVFRRVRKHLVDYFGPERLIDSITPGDACDWRQYLIGRVKLADNTVRRHCGIARQFFKSAIRHKLITENPFVDDEIKVTVRGNDSRFYFVTVAEAERVLAACPDDQWRLLFALSRFGGLRCPSEHLALTWDHVDFETGRLTIPSPKTAHHEGKAQRVMPIFPELRVYLEAVRKAALAGSQRVITRYRESSSNLRMQLGRIIARAGLKTWPKLFHNLRATRQTELSDRFPAHVVSEWLGNSEAVARKHYLHTTDEHFQRALSAGGSLPGQKSDAQSDALFAPQPDPARLHLTAYSTNTTGNEKPRRLAGVKMGDEGLEPPTSTL